MNGVSAGAGSPTTAALRAAEGAARDAADASGVRLRQLETLEEYDTSLRLYGEIWRVGPTNPPATRELLRALTASGSYVVGAFDESGMVGAGFAFFCSPGARGIHSHIAGVSTAGQQRGVGFAMKVHQRAWALAREVTSISWTFDPLVRRNAHFNLVKLRANASRYLPNFYGSMADTINGADDSDRLLVTWDLLSSTVTDACKKASVRACHRDSARSVSHMVGVGLSTSQRPIPGRLDAVTTTIAVPHDIEALRVSDPHLANEWRRIVRESLGALLGAGGRIVAFDDEAGYVVSRGSSSS